MRAHHLNTLVYVVHRLNLMRDVLHILMMMMKAREKREESESRVAGKKMFSAVAKIIKITKNQHTIWRAKHNRPKEAEKTLTEMIS